MLQVRFLPPAAKYMKKLKDKKLIELYKNAIDEICMDYTVGEQKTANPSNVKIRKIDRPGAGGIWCKTKTQSIGTAE